MSLVKLKKIEAGVYATLDGRYQVEHQDGETECDHPNCFNLHRKYFTWMNQGRDWVHYTGYRAWHVWDVELDDYLDNRNEEYDTKRQAHQALTDYLKRQEQQA